MWIDFSVYQFNTHEGREYWVLAHVAIHWTHNDTSMTLTNFKISVRQEGQQTSLI